MDKKLKILIEIVLITIMILPIIGELIYTAPRDVAAQNVIVLRYGGQDTADVDVTGDGVADYRAAINPWNMNSASGTQVMYIYPSNNTVRIVSDLTNIQPAHPTNGYPEIYVGRKPWDRSYVNGFGVQFPMSVDNMRSFVVSFSVCINSLDSSMSFDIAADAWIVRPSVANSPGTAPSQGDVEIMVWLFSQNLNPAGSRVGTETIPIIINGQLVNAQWEVWVQRQVSWGGWDYIAFRPSGWSVRCGSVAYDPTLFIQAAKKYASMSGYYLLDWEIGVEWGTQNNGGRLARFDVTFSNFRVYYGTITTTTRTTTTTTSPRTTTTTTTRTTTTTATVTSPVTTTTVGSVSVRISVASDWGTGISVNIYISNNGNQIVKNWSLKIRMTSQITSIWGANYQNLGNNIWLLTPVSWSSTIYPRLTITIGFIANKQGSQPYPSIVEFTYTT